MIEFIEKIPDALLQVLTDANNEDSTSFKMLQNGVRVALDSGELQYGEDDDNGEEEQDRLFKRVAADINDQSGSLYLTSDSLIWYNNTEQFGFSFDYQAIVLHALVEATDTNWDLYMQVEAGKLLLPDASELHEEDYDPQDCQDDCLTWDVTMSVGPKEVADRIFHYIAALSASEMVLAGSEDKDDEDIIGETAREQSIEEAT